MTKQELPKEVLEAMAKLEQWFSEQHDSMYEEHKKLAKAHDLYCKFFESAMGAHDQAWVQWTFFLQDCHIPIDVSRGWRMKK